MRRCGASEALCLERRRPLPEPDNPAYREPSAPEHPSLPRTRRESPSGARPEIADFGRSAGRSSASPESASPLQATCRRPGDRVSAAPMGARAPRHGGIPRKGVHSRICPTRHAVDRAAVLPAIVLRGTHEYVPVAPRRVLRRKAPQASSGQHSRSVERVSHRADPGMRRGTGRQTGDAKSGPGAAVRLQG